MEPQLIFLVGLIVWLVGWVVLAALHRQWRARRDRYRSVNE